MHIAIYLLLMAMEAGPVWNPLWPPEVPPDAFSTTFNAEGIRLDSGLSLDNKGNFPFFYQGRAWQVNSSAQRFSLTEINLSPPPSDESESGASTEKPQEISIEILDPLNYRYTDDSGTYLIVIEEDTAYTTETWYRSDATGRAQAAIGAYIYMLDGALISGQNSISTEGLPAETTYFYYDNAGRITGIETGSSRTDAVYNAQGQPLKVSQSGSTSATYEYKWDAAGRLIYLFINGNEHSYNYTNDQNKNWTSRRETSWAMDEGWLFPQSSTLLTRTLTYGH
jgi:YD repeat-containing protein